MSSGVESEVGKPWSRLIRFIDDQGSIRYGQPRLYDPSAEPSLIKEAYLVEGGPYTEGRVSHQLVTVKKLLAPLVPYQVLGIGLNYKRHAEETKMPLPEYPILFTKSPSSLQNPYDPISIPKVARDPPEVDYECELAVVIARDCKNVSEEDALTFVLGYTVANDVSARRWQGKKGGTQWCFAKSFDTFLPLGPVLMSARAIPDPNNLRISTTLNGNVMQDSNTKDMIFSVRKLVSFFSQSTTLKAGTVISTGTPEGIGFVRNPPVFLKAGDSVTIAIEGIGRLTNPVEEEQ